ncbi:MAG: hypothetical protein JTT11_10080 [Candidatus Brockarchaeota archaeon]|nr:hypothetical protein [Candidatus Brockarchaeota archaeon]
MYRDSRSKRIVAVINCVLNQNARAPDCAVFPGMNAQVVDVLKKHGVGVIQMPCPEMTCIDLPRSRPEGASINDVLDTPKGRECCRKLSASVVDQIQEFVENGFKVLAILGGDVGSPGCAVHLSTVDGTGQGIAEGSGVFIMELHAELRKRGIEIPFRGIRDSDPNKLAEDILWVDRLLAEP